MVSDSTKASFALEGRSVPEGHVRSAAVQQYIDELVAEIERLREMLAPPF